MKGTVEVVLYSSLGEKTRYELGLGPAGIDLKNETNSTFYVRIHNPVVCWIEAVCVLYPIRRYSDDWY